MDVVSAVLIFTVVGVWLAALGRQTQPRAERMPVSEWGLPDLIANIAIGYTQLVAVQERMRGTAARHRPEW